MVKYMIVQNMDYAKEGHTRNREDFSLVFDTEITQDMIKSINLGKIESVFTDSAGKVVIVSTSVGDTTASISFFNTLKSDRAALIDKFISEMQKSTKKTFELVDNL